MSIDQQVCSLKSDAGKLKTYKTQEDTNKNRADAFWTIGQMAYLQRKMGIYVAHTAAATGMDSVKQTTILQKIERETK
jgi:hypothetical protein